jgi:hypothetical protein
LGKTNALRNKISGF